MNQTFLLSIIVPIFNEEDILKKFFPTLKESISEYNYEIIFVDDGSKDSSLKLLRTFLKNDRTIKIIKLKRNFGQQNAIYTGLCCAIGDCAVVLDADLQDPPHYIRQMILEWQKGNKIVFAQRKSRDDNFIKKMCAYLFYRIYKLIINNKAYPDTGDFYLIDKKVLKNIINIPESRFFLRGIIARETSTKTSILIHRKARCLGKTKYSTKKMLKLAFHAFCQPKLKTRKKEAKDFIDKIIYESEIQTTQ